MAGRTAHARQPAKTLTREDRQPLVCRRSPQGVLGRHPSLTHEVPAAFLAIQERLAASTFNRGLAALRSFVRWCHQHRG